MRTQFTVGWMLVGNWKLMSLRKMQKYSRQSHTKEKQKDQQKKEQRDREQRPKLARSSPPLLLSCSALGGEGRVPVDLCSAKHALEAEWLIQFGGSLRVPPGWPQTSVCVLRAQIPVLTQLPTKCVLPLGMDQVTSESPPAPSSTTPDPRTQRLMFLAYLLRDHHRYQGQ